MSIAFIIPARLAASRLPGKPLLDIQGMPMIIRVLKQVEKANLGPVFVACDGIEIAQVIQHYGGKAIQTDPALPSGTDRVRAALEQLSIHPEMVVNVQGDLPFIDPKIIQNVLKPLVNSKLDLATLGAPIHDPKEWILPQVVKALIRPLADGTFEAYDFQRNDPETLRKQAYHHIGIYAFRTPTLHAFCQLPPSQRELTRKLEQMRALDNEMRIGLHPTNQTPMSVDTPEDLERARHHAI